MQLLVVAFLGAVVVAMANANPDIDYWSDGYDKSKNCESEEDIKQLSKLPTKQCTTNYKANITQALEECRHELAMQLFSKCRLTGVKQPGEMLFCQNRDVTTCCFHKDECQESWTGINEEFTKIAVNYMTDKEKFLKNLSRTSGYKTCHPIDGLDASICAKDCEEFKKSDFAKFCADEDGLLKCCIRRDKANCHECRYCCTFPFCTNLQQEDGVYRFNQIGEGSMTKNMTNQTTLSAIDTLLAFNVFYKGSDSRCLKPDSADDPLEWRHYVPEDFYAAVTKEELSKARTHKYDNRFFNFEDPKVLEQMTGPHRRKNFAEVYGYDFMSNKLSIPDKSKSNRYSFIYPCARRCLIEEHTNFARSCAKKGGLLKCCVDSLGLDVFHDTRETLKKKGLISEPIGNTCDDDRCMLCTLTVVCTMKDEHTGQIFQEYKTDFDNPVGGITLFDQFHRPTRTEFRVAFCIRMDFCSVSELIYDSYEYFFAHNRMEFCNVTTKGITEEFIEVKVNHTEEYKSCVKRQSNVRLCPQSILKTMNNKYLTTLNNSLKRIKKSIRMRRRGRRNGRGGRRRIRRLMKRRRRKSKHLKKIRSRHT